MTASVVPTNKGSEYINGSQNVFKEKYESHYVCTYPRCASINRPTSKTNCERHVWQQHLRHYLCRKNEPYSAVIHRQESSKYIRPASVAEVVSLVSSASQRLYVPAQSPVRVPRSVHDSPEGSQKMTISCHNPTKRRAHEHTSTNMYPTPASSPVDKLNSGSTLCILNSQAVPENENTPHVVNNNCQCYFSHKDTMTTTYVTEKNIYRTKHTLLKFSAYESVYWRPWI